MKIRGFWIFLGIFFILFLSFGSNLTKASGEIKLTSISEDNGANVVDTISVEKKNILVPNLQEVTVNIKNNNGIGYTGGSYTGVQYITVSYKLPSGGYNQIHLSRNNLSETAFKGYINTSYNEEGTWIVAEISEYFFNGGFRIYFDKDEGGSYELDDGNFTAYSLDITGPILDNIFVDNPSALPGENVTITVNTHDELSDIQNVKLTYKVPNNGGYYDLLAQNIGNDQFQLTVPNFMTSGYKGYGKFECTGITLTDSFNNSTTYYDDTYYSTRDLSVGDFIVKSDDITPPNMPKVNDVTDKSTGITGTAEAGSTITIKAGTNVIGTAVTKEDGTFLVPIALQKAGTKLSVTAKDSAGNVSGTKKVIVKDITPPNMPVVNDVTDKSTGITGTAEAGSTITIKAGTNVIGTAVTKEDGTFLVPIALQKAGTKLSVTAKDSAGNVSGTKKVIVKDITPPNMPIVNDVTDKSTGITGTAEAGSTITIKAGTNVIGTAVTKEDGTFLVPIALQKAGTKLSVTAKDSAGNVSEAKKVIVKDITPPNMPVVNDVTDKSTGITGTAEAGSTITIKAGTNVIGTAVTKENGTFLVPIALQKAGTKLSVTAKDSAGNVSEAKKVIVKDITSPNMPKVNDVTDKSTGITGTAEAGSTITIKAGTNVIGTAVTKENGTILVPIALQKAGTKLSVTAKDSAGNVSGTKKVTVKAITPPNIPTVN